jgi:5-methylcytosine-specific restriction endonuclease McrA
MRFRSRKMEAKYRQRRVLVAQILDDEPICQRCKLRRATEVHEVLSRARGGDILNRDNCVALCHYCHRFITEHPRLAADEGWLRHSWERYLADEDGRP